MAYSPKNSHRPDSVTPPFSEMMKSVPGMFGIRLDEEPHYALVSKSGKFELREYSRMTLASVSMKLAHDEFEEAAFKILASYIFSNDIEMTIPVYKSRTGDEWTMSFVLPHSFRAKSAPSPEHAAVKVREVKAHRAAVLRFSGNVTEEKMIEQAAELKQWMAKNAIGNPDGDLCWAQYDQPMAIPFMKRNEVQITVD